VQVSSKYLQRLVQEPTVRDRRWNWWSIRDLPDVPW